MQRVDAQACRHYTGVLKVNALSLLHPKDYPVVNNGVQIFIITPYKITSYKYDHASYEAYFRKEVVYNIRLSYID